MERIKGLLLILAFVALGCTDTVPKDQAAGGGVGSEREAANAQILDLQAEVASAQDSISALEAEREAANAQIMALEAELNNWSITTVQKIENVEYCMGDNIPLLLDIYLPNEPLLASPMPAIIGVHGGGWSQGDKSGSGVEWLARFGFVAVSIDYRLSGTAKFPAAVQDANCAVRWLRANAGNYGVDPDHIGIWGSSSGGHLAMMVGTADGIGELEGSGGWDEYSSRVQAVVAVAAIGTLTDTEITKTLVPAIHKFLGTTIESNPELFRQASPTTYVSADDPPLLLINDELDPHVPIGHAEAMYSLYTAVGADVRLVKPKGMHSHRPVANYTESLEAGRISRFVTLEFLKEHLVRQ